MSFLEHNSYHIFPLFEPSNFQWHPITHKQDQILKIVFKELPAPAPMSSSASTSKYILQLLRYATLASYLQTFCTCCSHNQNPNPHLTHFTSFKY
jgi:hypothetical protein